MIGEFFSGPERKPVAYILSNAKPLITHHIENG